jgi:hypothetical protein
VKFIDAGAFEGMLEKVVLFFHLSAVNDLAKKFLILNHHQLFVLYSLSHIFLNFLFCLI